MTTNQNTPPKLTPNQLIEIFGNDPGLDLKEIIKRNITKIYPRWKWYRDYRREMQKIIDKYPATTPMMELKKSWRIKYNIEIPGYDMSPRELFSGIVWHVLWREEDQHKKDSRNLRRLKQMQDILNRGPQPEQGISAEQIKERVDLVSYVEAYTELKQRGQRHLAKCPLPDHNERTASFVVYEGGKGWYCYGCHKGGSVIDFVMEIEKVSFGQAMLILNSK